MFNTVTGKSCLSDCNVMCKYDWLFISTFLSAANPGQGDFWGGGEPGGWMWEGRYGMR